MCHVYHLISQTPSTERHILTVLLSLCFSSLFPSQSVALLISLTDLLFTEQLYQLPLPPLLPPTLPPPFAVTVLHKLRWIFFTLSPDSAFTHFSQDAMRLTALCVRGTLLALLSLSWTIVDSGEGDIVGAKGFGPCAATLQSEGLCREGQDESTCPYLFSLPPLTVHLPKQLGELEKIMKDLEKLKDNVDQLRKMCADCTVSQTERECGRQLEREHVKLNEGTDAREDESSWVKERNPERLKNFRQECGTDGVRVENTMEGDGNTDSEKGTILEERERKKWEAERESDKGAVKENEKAETLKRVAENDGKTQREGAKGKDKLGQSEKPTAGGNERTVDTVRVKVDEKNNRETGRETDKEKERKWDWKGDREKKSEKGKERETATRTKNKEKIEESDHHVWRDEIKETDKKTRTGEDRDSDGTKMSEEHSKHTNKEQEQPKKDMKKETEKAIKVEQNNEKLKQTESIRRAGKETTVKEGEEEEEGRETGRGLKPEGEKMVQSVQRDSDGELTSTATQTTSLVSVSPTPQSSLSLAPQPDSMNSNKATISTSSLPSPPLPGSHLITDVNQGLIMPPNGPPTQSTGDEETRLRITSRPATATHRSFDGLGQQTTSATFILTSTTSPRQGADFEDQVSSTTASTTTTTKSQAFNTTAVLGERDSRHWTAQKNISSDNKMIMNPRPGEKHKPGINPERDQSLKNPKNDRKQTKPNQKQKPSYPKLTSDQKPRSGKGPQQVHIPKPEQRAPPDNLTTDQTIDLTNKANKPISKHDQKPTTEPNNLINQQPKVYQTSIPPVQRPTSNQRPLTVNTAVPESDPESAEIPTGNQNSKPEKRLRRPLQTNKPNQKQKPEKKPKDEEKTKQNPEFEPKQYFTPESESESEIQKFVTDLMGNSDENPSLDTKSNIDSTAGEKPTIDRIDLSPDQKPEPSKEILILNQNLTHGHVPKHYPTPQEPTTDQRIKTNVEPKPGKLPQTNQGLKTPWPGQIPKLNPKSVPYQIPEVESDKTPKPKPPPAHRPPVRPTFRPGATSVQRLKPAVQLKPNSKTKTDLDPPHISGTTSDGIQNSQTGMSPPSGPIKQTAVTPGAKTSSSQETQSFPLRDTLPQGFTMNPNSRTTSDLRPQTAGQPSSIPMTTRPNKIIRGILPSVLPSTSPGSTKLNLAPNTDTILQEKILHNVEQTAHTQTPDPGDMTMTATSPSAHTTSTLSPDFRSTTPATSGLKPPAAESPTPSTRELRVKINQVAAFLNNSLNPNGPSLDRRPKEQPEYSQGGSRPEPRRPTHIPNKGKIYFLLCTQCTVENNIDLHHHG